VALELFEVGEVLGLGEKVVFVSVDGLGEE
jgi:hypothetical protein